MGDLVDKEPHKCFTVLFTLIFLIILLCVSVPLKRKKEEY